MCPYKIMVDDNFHYGEESERTEYGTVATAEEALAVCRRIVDESLLAEYRDGTTAERLHGRYTSFGDDPFVVALDGVPKIEFSAWTFARERAAQLTAPGLEGVQCRRDVLDRTRTRQNG
jgi:hypothetical protein